MLETILSVLGSAAGGGVLGIFGNYLKGKTQLKLERLKYDREIKMEELGQASMRLESELKIQEISLQNEGKAKLANIEATREHDIAITQLQEASYLVDKASYGGGWVDSLRGATRPLLTIFSVGLLSFIAIKLTFIISGLDSFSEEYLRDLYKQILSAVIFLSTASFAWWFGSRPPSNN